MKTAIFEIFRTGKHNGRNAKNIHWSNDQLATIQRFYTEQIQPAPLVIGHPEDNRPEYGTVKRLIHHENALFAEAEYLARYYNALNRAILAAFLLVFIRQPTPITQRKI